MDELYGLKTTVINNVQGLFDNYQELNEKTIRHKCEIDLQLREYNDTIKKQESYIKELNKKNEELENTSIKKDRQIHEYSELINNFERKVYELTIEKDEKERFDITCVQANTILAKEKEIERLMGLLKKSEDKKKNTENEKKVLNVIDIIEKQLPPTDEVSVIVIKNEVKTTEQENKENKEEDDQNNDDSCEEDEDYDIITYRKKEYWIKTGEIPQYVYEVINDDELGGRIGVYKSDKKGKLKVFLDK